MSASSETAVSIADVSGLADSIERGAKIWRPKFSLNSKVIEVVLESRECLLSLVQDLRSRGGVPGVLLDLNPVGGEAAVGALGRRLVGLREIAQEEAGVALPWGHPNLLPVLVHLVLARVRVLAVLLAVVQM